MSTAYDHAKTISHHELLQVMEKERADSTTRRSTIVLLPEEKKIHLASMPMRLGLGVFDFRVFHDLPAFECYKIFMREIAKSALLLAETEPNVAESIGRFTLLLKINEAFKTVQIQCQINNLKITNDKTCPIQIMSYEVFDECENFEKLKSLPPCHFQLFKRNGRDRLLNSEKQIFDHAKDTIIKCLFKSKLKAQVAHRKFLGGKNNTTQKIAEALNLKPSTVKSYWADIPKDLEELTEERIDKKMFIAFCETSNLFQEQEF